MLQSARPQIGHSDSRPALRQPGSTNAMPSHCSRASDRLRRHVARNSGQLRHASLRSAVAQQIRAQPVAAPDVAIPQVQLPRLPLGFSLAAYPSLVGCNVLVTGVYTQPYPHPWALHLIMPSIGCCAHYRSFASAQHKCETTTACLLRLTGSGRGIGFYTAQLLALMGANVYITDLTAAAIAAAVASIMSSDGRCAVAHRSRFMPIATKLCCCALPTPCMPGRACVIVNFDPSLQRHRQGGAAHGPGRPALRCGVRSSVWAAAGRGATARAGQQRGRKLHGARAVAHRRRRRRHPPSMLHQSSSRFIT